MSRIHLRVRIAALAAIFAACSSSPLEVDSEAAKGPKFQVSPLVLDFGSSGTTATVRLENPTKRAMSWTASESAGWLSLGASSGTLWAGTKREFSISGSRTGLSPGTYTTDVIFSASNGGGKEVQTVSLTVPSTETAEGKLSVSPLRVDFGSTATSQTMTLSNTGDASLSWTASEGAGWLSLGATSGTISAQSSQTLALSVDRTRKTAGDYTTDLVVSAGTAGSVTAAVSMTVPSSATTSEVVLSGRLIDQFGGLGIAGLTVQFGGKSATTDATGAFAIAGSPTTSTSDLTLSGSAIHRRLTSAQTGDALWSVVPSSFNMAAFDDVAREEFGSSTVRWVTAPTVYVDTNPQGFDGGTELQTWIAEVQVQAAEFVSNWTGATISPADVIVTSRPPKDFSTGTIVIHFSEEASDYGNTSSIGYARLSWNSDRSINGAALWLRYLQYSGSGKASKRRGILGHELGHTMGLGHMNGSSEVSLMAPSLGSKTDLSPYDTRVASLLYGRRPGNASLDIDGSSSGRRGLLVPAGAPVERDWLCDAGDAVVPRGD